MRNERHAETRVRHEAIARAFYGPDTREDRPADALSGEAIERQSGGRLQARAARNWIAGRNAPGPTSRQILTALGITIAPAPRRVGRWWFPSRNWVEVLLMGPLEARQLAMEWRRPLSTRDLVFYEEIIAPAIVKKLGVVLELPPPPMGPEA